MLTSLANLPSTIVVVFIALMPSVSVSVSAAVAACSDPGWASHQLEVLRAAPGSAINSTNLPDSFFGVEGGHIIAVNVVGGGGGSGGGGGHANATAATLYAVIAEFTAPPLWVPSRIALWKAAAPSPATGVWPRLWTRVSTLFTSGGKTDCADPRASLGSSASLAWNPLSQRYEVFYVGFKSCNDSAFVNRHGEIYRAVAAETGPAGLEGPFVDEGVVLAPGAASEAWEGTQGVDSMQPYPLGSGKGWASFYGSAGVTPDGSNHGTISIALDFDITLTCFGLRFSPARFRQRSSVCAMLCDIHCGA